jgi:hypothetical protein
MPGDKARKYKSAEEVSEFALSLPSFSRWSSVSRAFVGPVDSSILMVRACGSADLAMLISSR